MATNDKDRKRRVPGQSAKKPQKAPPVKPRKNPPVQETPARVVPEVVYLPPKHFSRNRFVLRLATVVAVVMALMLGLSIFFKVERVEVSGCEKYSAWQIKEASGISEGDQLLTFSRAAAASRIRAQLPYVKTVRIGVSLPNTVKIEIVETAVTYALQDTAGNWWLMDCAGKLIEQAEAGSQTKHTLVSGVTLQNPKAGEQAVASEPEPGTDSEGNVIPVTVTGAQRLAALLTVAENLERNGIIGEAASIDVENLFEIELWYGEKYQVLLGDTQRLDYKITCLKAVVDEYAQSRPYESGVLDISDPDWIEYQSFTE